MKTMTRRSLAIVLAVMMVFSSMIMGAITANAANYDWYLVGDNADIFGAAWTPAQEANGMTKQADGTYIKTYEITKAATVEYKITDSQGWSGENQVPRYTNQSVTVAAGDTLTFTYNGTTLTASTGKPVVTYDYYVAGVAGLCGAEWNPSAEANGMTKQADGSYTKVYENVAAGTYKYKVTNGSWNTTYTDGSAGDNDNNSQVVVETADSTVTITLSSDKKVSSAVVAPAAPTTAEPTTAEPTTAEPTTVEPTTVEPTTVEPTTAEPTTAAPATTKTIYFTNADAWTTVNVYAYKMKSETEAVKLTGEWPGTAMTDAGKNEYQQQLVKADVDTSAEFVIFNNGTSEYKGAFDAEKNAYYWDGTKLVAYEYTVVEPTTAEPTTAEPTTAEPTTAEPTTAEPTTAEPTTAEPTTVEPTTAEPTTAAPATTKTIYFTNADAWTTVNVYAYKMKSETEAVKLTGEWPGTAMTDAGKNEYQQQLVKADVDTSAEFVIFNDGTSEYKGAFDAEKNAYYWDGTKLVAYEYTVVEPTTAEPTTAEPTTAEPTTVEPTTAEPTTAEPTTAEPTTVEPTTAEPTTAAPATTKTIYFTNADAWTTVNVYAYKMKSETEAVKLTGEWPGTAMTDAGKNEYQQQLVKADVDTSAEFVIFNNGTSEYKGAFDAEKNAYYWDGTKLVAYEYTVVEPTTAEPTTAEPTTAEPTTAEPTTAEPTTAPATTKTIYFTNADAWTTVNVYAYKMKSETEAVKLTGEWPGTAMTDAGKNEYQQQLVKADVDTSAEFVIFNDGTTEYKGAFDAEKNAYYWDGTKLVAYEYTVVEPTTAEPTTAEPTTVEPTTAEPTTVEPTTAEPTTQPAPVLADGFYLAGVDGHWTVDTISADLKFNANPGKEGEYVLNTTLKAGDGIKVVKVESNAIKAYYPDPGDNYTVTAEDAGAVTIYFSETYSVQWEKFGGYFYITPQAFDYTVTYNYNYDGEDLTVTKTVTAEAANIEDAIKANAPKVDNPVSDYAVGEIKKGEGNTYSVTLDATAKKYTVSLNGQPMDQEFAYMDKATVTSDKDAAFIIDGQVVGYGKSFTFFVVGDTDVTTDETKTIEDFASISKTATIAADGKVTVELLASAVVEKFDRMGVAFAKAEKTQAEIEAAVKAITSGTAASNKIAVHNSDVTEANESGQYQFIYAPYVTDGYSGKLYFYTFAVDTDGNVLVSAASEVDYANIGK